METEMPHDTNVLIVNLIPQLPRNVQGPVLGCFDADFLKLIHKIIIVIRGFAKWQRAVQRGGRPKLACGVVLKF